MKQYYRILLLILTFLYANLTVGQAKDKVDLFMENGTKIISLSPGFFAPYGVMCSLVNEKGNGVYFSSRINKNVFKKSKYYFVGSKINETSLNWKYNEEKIYSRMELNAGAQISFLRFKNDAFKISGMLGLGILMPRYLYSFAKSGYYGTTQEWVLYKEISKPMLNIESALVFTYNNAVNFHVGVSGIQKKHERMLYLGLGFYINNKH